MIRWDTYSYKMHHLHEQWEITSYIQLNNATEP